MRSRGARRELNPGEEHAHALHGFSRQVGGLHLRHLDVGGALAANKVEISDAQNADFKSLLESVRSVVAEHDEHAQALIDSLSK